MKKEFFKLSLTVSAVLLKFLYIKGYKSNEW